MSAPPFGGWPPPTTPVTSVFGRIGAVIAALGDYTSSQITNASSVSGATVTAALNTLTGVVVTLTSSAITNASGVAGATVTNALNTLAAAIAAIPSAPVSTVFARTGAIVATLGDYAASLISNNSSVSGTTVRDALNTLLAAIPSVPVSSVFARTGAVVATSGDYAASKITNDSSVSGSTTKDALNALSTGKAKRDPIWDAPTVASADDEECDTDFLAAGTGGWTLALNASLGTPMTRDGNLDLTQAITTGHYRSVCIGSTLFIQLRQNEGCLLWKQVAAALSTQQLWVAGVGMAYEPGTSSFNDAQMSVQVLKATGATPDFNNRVFIVTSTNPDRYFSQAVVASAAGPVVPSGTQPFAYLDALALRVNHGSAASGNAGGFGYTRSGAMLTVCPVDAPQLNAATTKVGIGMQGNVAQPPVFGINSVVYAFHFLRRIDLAAGGWVAQS